MEFIPLIVGVVTPILMGAIAAALKYKEKNLGNGEEFSDAKFYSTLIVAAGIGLVNFFTNGVLISEVDLQTQLMAYTGIIVLTETVIKLFFRAAGQSPTVVTALVGKDAGAAVAQVVEESKASGGEVRSIIMPEANFNWMTFGHTPEDVLRMKSQVMAAEEAGLKHYYVTWSNGVYLIEFGEVYGTNLQYARPGEPNIVPAPGAH
jgi:hypothetical protein